LKEEPRRLSDRISDPAYLAKLDSVATPELREMREECEELEAEISFTRRLLHGKMDIVRHELERRAAGGDRDIQTLVQRLPSILGEGRGGSGGRHLKVLVPRNADVQRRMVEKLASDSMLANIDDLSAQELSNIMGKLAGAEVKASEQRKQIQDAMDRVRGELIRRYKEGQEDPFELLPSTG
jgi:anti-sigma-K factor RsiG